MEVSSSIAPIPISVKNVPGRTSPAGEELIFLAEDLPPLQQTQFHVDLGTSSHKAYESISEVEHYSNEDDTTILKSSNGKRFHFDPESNNLVKMYTYDKHGTFRQVEFTQQYFYYTGYQSGSLRCSITSISLSLSGVIR